MPVIYIADGEFSAAILSLEAQFVASFTESDWVVSNDEGMEYIIRRESERDEREDD